MTPRIFLLALICVAAGFAAAPVTAQESPVDSSTATEEPVNDCTQRITSYLSICEYRYAEGTVTLVFEATRETQVTLTDAGGVNEEGFPTQKDVRLVEGKNRVRISATKVSGKVLVTIDTDRGLYSPGVLETGAAWLPGPYDESDMQNAALGGVLAGLSTVGIIGYRKVNGVSERPERVL